MRLRFSRGDRVGALRAYANGRAVLADQLQVELEPETVALAKRIRHTAPVASASGSQSSATSNFTRAATSEHAGRPIPGTNSRVRQLDRVLSACACGTASARRCFRGRPESARHAWPPNLFRLGTGAGGRRAGRESLSNREAAPIPATHRYPAQPTGAGTYAPMICSARSG